MCETGGNLQEFPSNLRKTREFQWDQLLGKRFFSGGVLLAFFVECSAM